MRSDKRTYIYLRAFIKLFNVNDSIRDEIVLSTGYMSYDNVKHKAFPMSYLKEFLR